MASEHEAIVELARIEATRFGGRLFKNQQGQGWVGGKETRVGRLVQLSGARRVAFGVCHPGGSDLIGWRPLRITQDMVGQTFAQFVAVECKTPGDKERPEQKQFLCNVAASGGIAAVARRRGDSEELEYEEYGR